MPVVINEMSSHFDVRDDAKLRKLIAKEVKSAIKEEKSKGARSGGNEPDPSDPSASGRPGEGG
jgi:hypothetical protein